MPILGNLSEFPLPEVLLLIGARTGRLRLLDVPEFGMMDVDFSEGEVQAMYIGDRTFTESKDMIAKLSAVVQLQTGMFEFRVQLVASVPREQPLRVNELVMTLVCYVDEQMALQQASAAVGHRFILAHPQPDVWVAPELSAFFLMARQFLTSPGIHLHDLARHLCLDSDVVHKNLTNLRLLGYIRLIDEEEAAQVVEMQTQENISRKSSEYFKASRAAAEIQRMTTNLPLVNAQ